MTRKISWVDVEKYAYYVNNLRQNVGLVTWLWRQIVTSQTAHTKYKWSPYATEWNPPWKISVYATVHLPYFFGQPILHTSPKHLFAATVYNWEFEKHIFLFWTFARLFISLENHVNGCQNWDAVSTKWIKKGISSDQSWINYIKSVQL